MTPHLDEPSLCGGSSFPEDQCLVLSKCRCEVRPSESRIGTSPGVGYFRFVQFGLASILAFTFYSNLAQKLGGRLDIGVRFPPVCSQATGAGGGEHRLAEALENRRSLRESLARRIDACEQSLDLSDDSFLLRQWRKRDYRFEQGGATYACLRNMVVADRFEMPFEPSRVERQGAERRVNYTRIAPDACHMIGERPRLR